MINPLQYYMQYTKGISLANQLYGTVFPKTQWSEDRGQ